MAIGGDGCDVLAYLCVKPSTTNEKSNLEGMTYPEELTIYRSPSPGVVWR